MGLNGTKLGVTCFNKGEKILNRLPECALEVRDILMFVVFRKFGELNNSLLWKSTPSRYSCRKYLFHHAIRDQFAGVLHHDLMQVIASAASFSATRLTCNCSVPTSGSGASPITLARLVSRDPPRHGV